MSDVADETSVDDYLWIVIVGALAMFFTSFGIGANDVANVFGTSVGSRAITLKQAVAIAAVCEFSGAVAMGNLVSGTIRSGIIDIDAYRDQPGLLMFGMQSALLSTGTWLMVASYYEMPVSTTHSIIGGIMGFGIMSKGVGVVKWGGELQDEFPYVDGVAAICASWLISPVISGVIAATMFWLVRHFILRRENSLERAWMFYPFLVAVAVTIISLMVLYKGAARASDFSDKTASGSSSGTPAQPESLQASS